MGRAEKLHLLARNARPNYERRLDVMALMKLLDTLPVRDSEPFTFLVNTGDRFSPEEID